jgi:hypothetical protein
MTTMTIYRPAEAPMTQTVVLSEAPTYDELRKVLRPVFGEHHVQRITVLHGGRPSDMFVDERSHELGLPLNEAATQIYWSSSPIEDLSAGARDCPAIAGPAVTFSRRVWF